MGCQQKTFYMHKYLLHSVKGYFSDEFDPANPPIPDDMHLRFVTVPTFTVFAQWLYGRPIIFPGLNKKAKIDACITLHFFADEIFNNDFKNLVVDLIQDTLYEPNVYSKKQRMLSNYKSRESSSPPDVHAKTLSEDFALHLSLTIWLSVDPSKQLKACFTRFRNS